MADYFRQICIHSTPQLKLNDCGIVSKALW